MYIEIEFCPFCGSGKIYMEKWPEGYSWFCRNCKRDFGVYLAMHDSINFAGSFLHGIWPDKDDLEIPQTDRGRVHRKKKKKRKKKKPKHRR